MQDHPSRLLAIAGYTYELLHPDGTSFLDPRSALSHYSLRFAQPFLSLSGITPGYTPDQIFEALRQHNHLALQAAQAEGLCAPMPIAENIH